MAMQKIEFEFPDDEDGKKEAIESSSFAEVDTSRKKAKEVEEDELDIEIVDDTPPEDRNRKRSEPPDEVTDDELDNYSEKVAKRIKRLSKSYHDERRDREKAERERQEMERLLQTTMEEVRTLKGSVGNNHKVMLDQAKQTLTGQYDAVKVKLKNAHEAGDTDALIAAQDELADIKIRMDRVNNFKLPPVQEEKIDVKQQHSAQSEVKIDEKAQKWAEDNASWFQKDEEMTSLAMGYHTKLVRQGVDPRSDEYYEKLNARMREKFPEEFDDGEEYEEETPPAKKPKSSVVAPVVRGGPPKKVRLTKTQVDIANRMGVPLAEYAKQAALLMTRKD